MIADGLRDAPESTPLEHPAGVEIAPDVWSDRMLSGALRYRADRLRTRFDEEPDDRMVARVALAIAVEQAERAFRDVERADRSIHFMLEKPSRFTIADLQNARHARASALDDFATWADMLKDGADQFFGVDFVESLWFCGYVQGASKEPEK